MTVRSRWRCRPYRGVSRSDR